jgi:predicted transcriptional regulator
MIDYKTLIKCIDKYKEEAKRIFNRLYRADIDAKTDIIDYNDATFERIEWGYSNENYIVVRYYDYGYDLYESCCFDIPADIFFNDEKIDKWIETVISEAMDEKEKEEAYKKKCREEKDRKEYERLKEKFGE